MTSLMAATVEPSVADARKAAEPLLMAGAEEVWLFGSVARSEATERSDIDLLALFADINYSERDKMCRRLEAAALDAVDGRWPVQVFVTDRPEWKARSEQVRSSFEHRIRCASMIPVGDSGCRSQVRWEKPMERPINDLAEAWSKFDTQIILQLRNLQRTTLSGVEEFDATRTADFRDDARLTRMLSVCGPAALVVELSIKNLAAWHKRPGPTRKEILSAGHDIAACLNLLPAGVRLEVEDCLTALNINLEMMSSWRVYGTYVEEVRVLQDIADQEADRWVIAALETAALLYSDLSAASDPQEATIEAVREKWQSITTLISGQNVRSGQPAQSPYGERVLELTGRDTLLNAGPERPLRLDIQLPGEL